MLLLLLLLLLHVHVTDGSQHTGTHPAASNFAAVQPPWQCAVRQRNAVVCT
ncbi:MAG: hypothetical protein ACK41Y_16770 [Paracoccus hibiscisoli]|uniref:hypothetical protein n=1 Tax=Paracoccus hibiscisoli TaxID=2023261 RepID=UPI00391ACEFB